MINILTKRKFQNKTVLRKVLPAQYNSAVNACVQSTMKVVVETREQIFAIVLLCLTP